MKQIVSSFLILALLLGSGCQSSPSSYKTLKQVGDAVDTAMTAYADAVVAGQVTEANQKRVRDLYGDYRVAFQSAVDAARLDLKQAPPAQVVTVALSFINLVTQLTTKTQ